MVQCINIKSWRKPTLKYIKCCKQLTEKRQCPEQKYFDGLCIFKRAERMLKMTLAVDDQKQPPTLN
jgi:hypothetical protein